MFKRNSSLTWTPGHQILVHYIRKKLFWTVLYSRIFEVQLVLKISFGLRDNSVITHFDWTLSIVSVHELKTRLRRFFDIFMWDRKRVIPSVFAVETIVKSSLIKVAAKETKKAKKNFKVPWKTMCIRMSHLLEYIKSFEINERFDLL